MALVEVQLGGLSRGFIGGGRIGGSVRLVVLRRLSAACIGFVVVLGCGMGGGSIDVGFVEWFGVDKMSRGAWSLLMVLVDICVGRYWVSNLILRLGVYGW